jgi:hypothetical protein
MIKITRTDFDKFVNIIKKEGMDGADLIFKISNASLCIKTIDKSTKEIIIEISDSDYPFMPRITRTETF